MAPGSPRRSCVGSRWRGRCRHCGSICRSRASSSGSAWALAPRAADRYGAARELAEELRLFAAAATARDEAIVRRRAESPERRPASRIRPDETPGSAVAPVVPKGLRSFGPEDAEFFLELLHGPRDREGLPDSLRFWKARIEADEIVPGGRDLRAVGLRQVVDGQGGPVAPAGAARRRDLREATAKRPSRGSSPGSGGRCPDCPRATLVEALRRSAGARCSRAGRSS